MGSAYHLRCQPLKNCFEGLVFFEASFPGAYMHFDDLFPFPGLLYANSKLIVYRRDLLEFFLLMPTRTQSSSYTVYD